MPVMNRVMAAMSCAAAVAAISLAGCNGGGSSHHDDPAAGVDVNVPPVTSGEWYKPDVGVSWQLQLSGDVNTGYDAEIYDIDLFDTPATVIDSLQASGKKVICYFSAGSYEEWREDASNFDAAVLGSNLDGWPGERWLDIRASSVRSIMLTRLDLAQQKGCDGVDPDNVNGYTNNPGFDLTGEDQLAFNRFLANAAHERGLSVALKNDLEQIVDLVEYFDFSVNEQCHVYDECDLLTPFVVAGKPVLNVEYDLQIVNDPEILTQLCAIAASAGFSTVALPLLLDDEFRLSCQ